MVTGALALLALTATSSEFLVTPGGALVSVEDNTDDRFHLCLAVRYPHSVPPWQAHLAEHLLVSGTDGTLPSRLQDAGVDVQGQTSRYVMVIQMEGPANAVRAALDGLGELCAGNDDLLNRADHEVQVMVQEKAVLPPGAERQAEMWRKNAARGPMFPGPDDEPPDELLGSVLDQSNAACVLLYPGAPGQLATTVASALGRMGTTGKPVASPELPSGWASANCGAVRLGPVGTLGFVAGATACAAVASISGYGPYYCPLDAGPSYAVVDGDMRSFTPQSFGAVLRMAPAVARDLADRWTTDPSRWAQFKATSLLGGQRMTREDLKNTAELLSNDDFATALNRLIGR